MVRGQRHGCLRKKDTGMSLFSSLRGANTRRNSHNFRELTIRIQFTVGIRSIRGSRVLHLLFDIAEEGPAKFQVRRCPELFINIGGTQSLRPCFSESVLPTPNHSLEIHWATCEVCAIDRVRLGMFNVSLRITELALVGKQLYQAVIDPKLVNVPVEGSRYAERCLEVAISVSPFEEYIKPRRR